MGTSKHNLKLIVAALVAIVAISLPFSANSAGSDDLLQQLRQAGPKDAERIARDLQHEWDKSGSPAMDLLLKRGRDAIEAGRVDEAIGHLTALTDHAPDFAEGWNARALAYYQAGLFGPALADIERVLALNPQHYGAVLGLAVILEQTGRPKLAYEAYREVLAIHPHHEDVGEALERLEPDVLGSDL